ncbi:hypothetical protein [uncultured Cardiobacterium sp.]|uniref:hypothetical protein n=1 Tax=uncultured Cardiobacterium sp. TaxID=417619 RepID=UPI002609F97B|nr:hypothetical protein [uncultured Cardiobacterium sp.]
MPTTARLTTSGQEQTLHLPPAYRFNSEEIHIAVSNRAETRRRAEDSTDKYGEASQHRISPVWNGYIRRDPPTGDTILSAKPPDWQEYFALADAAQIADDFMNDRDTRPADDKALF